MHLYDISVRDGSGEAVSLRNYAGKVLLIVNTASRCGFTPQYKGLQELYDRYRDRGLEILAFPCNQFAAQEPGDMEEIKSFCSLNYGVTFPIFDKVDVNGEAEDPLFRHLKQAAPSLFGRSIKWNFTKFLVDRDGTVVARFSPKTEPADLAGRIEKLLAKEARV